MKNPRILATGIATLVLALPAFAVTDTWDGNLPNAGAGDSLLSTALNWADNSAPLSDLANTDLIFAGVTKLAPIAGVAFSTNSIVFNNTAGAFSLSGSTLSVGAGGITNNDIQTQTFGNVVTFGLGANSTINAASGGLTLNGAVTLPTTTLTLDGGSAITFGSTITGTGAITKIGLGAFNFDATATAIGADFNLTAGTTTLVAGSPQTLSSTSTVAITGTSVFNLNESLTLNGAQLTRSSTATLALTAGKTLTMQNGGAAILTGAFTNTTASTIAVTGAGSTFSTSSTLGINGGSVLSVSAGGDVSTGSVGLSIGTSGNGTVTVDGSGSSLGGGALSVGLSGDTGLLTFSNSSTGTFAAINVDNSATAGTSGTINIQSGATVTGTSLSIAPSAVANSGTVTINGASSALTFTGTTASTIGATSLSGGTVNVQSGGTFTSNTGTTSVLATGTVVIAGGTWNQNGNMILSGQMTRDATGTFTLAAGRTLTIQNGGDFTNSGGYTLATASTITVTGAGSTLGVNLAGSQLRLRGGSTLNVLGGGDANVQSSVFIGADSGGGNATVLVDGAGSGLNTTGGTLAVGDFGNTGALTFSNGAVGSFPFGLVLSSSATVTAGTTANVGILSGSLVSGGALSMAGFSTAGVAATLTIDGAGSALTQTGSSSSAIGAASGSTALLTIDNGGTFTTNTGTFTVNATGTVNIPDGTFNANGNVTVSGGDWNAGLNADFNLATNRTLTVSNSGTASFADRLFLTTNGSKVTVTGINSTLTGDEFFAARDNTISVSGGGDVSFAQMILGSGVAPASTSISGVGTTFSATASLEIGHGTVTYSSGSNGALASVAVDADPSGLIGVAGALFIQTGATVTAGTTEIANTGSIGAANTSALTVSGAGSTYTQTGSSQLQIGSSNVGAGISAAVLNVVDGGTYTSGTGLIFLNITGTINIDGGRLDLKGALQRNGGPVNFNTGEFRIVDNFVIGTGGLLGTSLTLDSTRSFTTTGTTTIDAFRTLTLNGGSFSTGSLVSNGNVVFNSGTLGITGAGGLNIGTGPLGGSIVLGIGSTLAVAQTTTVASGGLLRLDGGAFTGLFVVNNGTIDHQDGTLNIQASLNNAAGSRLFVGGLSINDSTITNAGRITLQNGLGLIGGAGSIQNTGIVTGDGTIGKAFTNSAGGQLRAEAGKTLFLTGTIATNAGTFSLEGGTLEFTNTVTNGASGVINGFGALRSALLTNNGNIGLSGDARFYGDVTNASGARIITSGGSTTTFYDDVIHNGAEIRTSAGGASVFFGAVSGAGPFTGTGTVYFEGDLKPGNSPASVLYEGDLVFGGASSLTLEIGGLVSGAQYDHLNVGGALHADGDLVLALLGGFTPQLGDTFDLLNVGTFAGDFDNISAPALSSGNAWDFSALKTNGSVSVVPEPGTATLLLASLSLLGFRRRKHHAPHFSPN